MRPRVNIWTDGCVFSDQDVKGRGGYAAILKYGNHRKEVTGGHILTRSQRMELKAVIAALEALNKPCIVRVHSDSRYVTNTFAKGWAARWKANGWRLRQEVEGKEPPLAKNIDLIDQILKLCETHVVEFIWVKGHNGNVENMRADQLARMAAEEATEPDPGVLPED